VPGALARQDFAFPGNAILPNGGLSQQNQEGPIRRLAFPGTTTDVEVRIFFPRELVYFFCNKTGIQDDLGGLLNGAKRPRKAIFVEDSPP
jgi:hypothetical protein